MSNKPILLSDNLLENTVLHPTFTVWNEALDDAPGREAFRVADNLRDMTSWTVTTTNVNRSVNVDCVTATTPSIIAVDRGHNLAGKQLRLAGYDDPGFTGGVTVWTVTVPSSPGGLPTDANGCLTPDGVWWKTFSGVSKRVHSVSPLAQGVGLAPILTGLYLGTSYRMPEFLNAPGAYDYGTQVKYMRNELSRGGVRSKSRPINFDRLSLSIDLDSADYAGFDAEVRRLLRYGQPWWFCLDDSDATGSGLMRCFQTAQDLTYDPQVNPVHRQIRLELEEVIPSLYA